jgi:hypothetical protein
VPGRARIAHLRLLPLDLPGRNLAASARYRWPPEPTRGVLETGEGAQDQVLDPSGCGCVSSSGVISLNPPPLETLPNATGLAMPAGARSPPGWEGFRATPEPAFPGGYPVSQPPPPTWAWNPRLRTGAGPGRGMARFSSVCRGGPRRVESLSGPRLENSLP